MLNGIITAPKVSIIQKIFVKKMVQRCGVWQIKPMTSPDQDPLSTKSNSSGFGSYSRVLQKASLPNHSNIVYIRNWSREVVICMP